MSRPYSSVSKWIPGDSDATSAARRGASESIALDAARNHERYARLVDHQRIGFVDERDVEGPVHEAAGVHRQQVAKVVKTGFLGGDVGHVREVGGAARCRRHPLLHVADRDPEPAIDRAHPLGIAPREIVVERQDMHAATRERVERRGHHGRQGLAFAGQHLDDLAIVQGEGRHELHVERALPEGAAGGLAHERVEGHPQGLARLAGASALAERLAPIAHLVVGQLTGCGIEPANGADERRVAAQVGADGRALQATNVVLEASTH